MSDLRDRFGPPDWAGQALRADGSVMLAPDVLRRLVRALDVALKMEASRNAGGRIERALLDGLHVLAESARLQEVLDAPPRLHLVAAQTVSLTTADAARRAGCSDRYVRDLAAAGRIDRLGFLSCEKVGKAWIITAKAA